MKLKKERSEVKKKEEVMFIIGSEMKFKKRKKWSSKKVKLKERSAVN